MHVARSAAEIVTRIPARIGKRESAVAERLLREAGLLDEGREATYVVFPAAISTDMVDAYHTHMMPSTLRNFAAAASEGRAFLDSHDSRKLPIGYSLRGEYISGANGSRTEADFYTQRGIRFGGQHSYESTDDFIEAMEARLVRDVSVGFYGGNYVCDICGNDYLSYNDCSHWAGAKYQIDGREGLTVCTVAIHDAQLSEVSAVYDGATPGAMLLKAEEGARAGALDSPVRALLEAQYRVKLPTPDPKVYVPMVRALGLTQETEMEWVTTSASSTADWRLSVNENEEVRDAEDVETPETEQVEDVETEEEEEVVTDEVESEDSEEADRMADLSARVKDLRSALATSKNDLVLVREQLEEARERIAALEPLAALGEQYRGDLIDQVCEEGVRAMGAEFPAETYRAMLAGSTVDHIRQIRDSFAKQAGERFQGGRQTQQPDEQEQVTQRRGVPDTAYTG